MRGKKRWKLAAAIIIATLLGMGIWMLLPAPEPAYKGKPLGYWLPLIGIYVADATDPARAVQAIGTNAIPALLHLMAARHSAWTERWNSCLDHVPWVHFQFETAETKHSYAMAGFKVLGPLGRDAVPDLIRIYERSPHMFSSRGAVAAIFANMGTAAAAAVPILAVGVASDTDPEHRAAAASALGAIASQPEASIPALLAALGDASALVRTSAAQALGRFDSRPDIIIPALCAALRDPSREVKYAAAKSLGKLQALPEIAIPALLAALADSDAMVSGAAALALGGFGPAARAALPTFRLWVFQRDNVPNTSASFIYRAAKEALAKISPSNSELCDVPN